MKGDRTDKSGNEQVEESKRDHNNIDICIINIYTQWNKIIICTGMQEMHEEKMEEYEWNFDLQLLACSFINLFFFY